MTWKIKRRKSVLKPAVVVVLATAGVGLLAQAASANPLIHPAVLADSGSLEVIEVGHGGGGHGHGGHGHYGYGHGGGGHEYYGRYGYHRWRGGYHPHPWYEGRWGYRGHHYFY